MINSKRKGKAGELELAHKLESLLGIEARRGQQFCGSADSPDIVHSIAGVHIECKRTEKLKLVAAVEQAIADAGDKTPVVMHRASRQPWLVSCRLDDLPRLAVQIYLTMAENK
jgi:Holliday junction resolvase